jgi:uncharacterized protein
MSTEVLRTFFARLETYLKTSDLAHFTIIIHGGEPLLAGHEFFWELGRLKTTLKESTGVDVTLTMQTNSLLLDNKWLETLEQVKMHIVNGDELTILTSTFGFSTS